MAMVAMAMAAGAMAMALAMAAAVATAMAMAMGMAMATATAVDMGQWVYTQRVCLYWFDLLRRFGDDCSVRATSLARLCSPAATHPPTPRRVELGGNLAIIELEARSC